MGTTLYRIDVIDIRMKVFGEAIIIFHGQFYRHAVFLAFDIDRLLHQDIAAGIQIGQEVLEPVGGIIAVALIDTFLILNPAVGQAQPQTLVQECQFPQTGRKDVIIVFGHRKNLRIGLESNQSPAVIRFADHLDRIQRLAFLVFLYKMLAFTEYIHLHMGRKRIHAGNTDPMQTAGNLVSPFIEFTPGMQHRHHHFQRATFFLRVHIGRNPSAVIPDRNRIILENSHFHMGTVTGQGFVYGVVHYFIDQMVQTPHIHIADVHRRPFAHGFQSFQYLDVLRGIGACSRFLFFYFTHYLYFLHSHIQKHSRFQQSATLP